MFARLHSLRHGLPIHPQRLASSMGRMHHRTMSFKRMLSNPAPPLLARFPQAYEIFRGIKIASGFLLAVHIFTDYFYDIRGTWGISMQPTLASSGDSVLVSKYYRHGRGVQVGDVISFKHPMREDVRASKRVIGMPGDFVLRDTPEKGSGVMIQVPQGHCWVVGDNLNHSRDSRMIGPIPLALVSGKIVAVFHGWTLWPRAVPGGLEDASDMWDEYR